MCLVQGQVFFQDLRDGEVIRAAAGAFAAVFAEAHRFHGFGGKSRGFGRAQAMGDDAVEHGRGDHDALRAGLAVFAAAAEEVAQLSPVPVHGGQIFRGYLQVLFIKVDYLVHPGHGIAAGQRDDIGKLTQERKSDSGIFHQAAAKRLHGQDAQLLLAGQGVQ